MSATAQLQGVGTLAYPFYAWFAGDLRPAPTVEDATGYEIDSRREFVWKAGAWHLRSQPAPVIDYGGVFGEMLAELRKLRFGLETYLSVDFVDPDA